MSAFMSTPYRHPANHPQNWKDDEGVKSEDGNPEAETPEADDDPNKATPRAEPDGTDHNDPFRDRYWNLKSHHDKTVTDLRTQVGELETRLKEITTSTSTLPSTKEQLEKWRKDSPQAYEMVLALAREEISKVRKESDTKLDAIRGEIVKAERDQAFAKLRASVAKAGGDFDSLQSDMNFHNWLATKSRMKQAAVYENASDWEAASEVFEEYLRHTAKDEKKPRKEPTGAESIRGTNRQPQLSPDVNAGGKKVWKESEVMDLVRKNPKIFDDDKFSDEIDAARVEGRFVMDVTNPM